MLRSSVTLGQRLSSSVVLATALWIAVARAETPANEGNIATEAGLVERVRGAIQAAALGDQIGVSVIDVRSGRALVSHNANLALNPASNQKLVTAAATLSELGADFQIQTGLYGRVEGDAVVAGLHLKGYGDPTLQTADMVALAQQLVARGIRRVDEVVVDGSYFDDQILPPGFDSQPAEVSPFRAAVAAVSVNANAFTMRITPGAAAGAPASVWLDAEGYFALTHTITTTSGGAANVIATQVPKGDKLTLRLSGDVPLGISGVTYRRRVESPLHYAGYLLVEALRALRIQVPRQVRVATMPRGSALLASHQSAPLASMLTALGKDSDNFTAEMLLKVLGAERVGLPGRTQNGARVESLVLKRLGLPSTSITISNGSGLFGDNRIAAAHLTRLLSAMYSDPGLRPEYVSHLAVAGVDGTLVRRLLQLPAPRIVRAKTGTVDDAIALSGYVLGRTPERVFAFSVLCNGIRGKQSAARALADQIATAIALHLWSERAGSQRVEPGTSAIP